MRTTSETFGTLLNAPNIRIIGVPEEDKKKGHEKILKEITVENFPKMGKETVTQAQENKVSQFPLFPQLFAMKLWD